MKVSENQAASRSFYSPLFTTVTQIVLHYLNIFLTHQEYNISLCFNISTAIIHFKSQKSWLFTLVLHTDSSKNGLKTDECKIDVVHKMMLEVQKENIRTFI